MGRPRTIEDGEILAAAARAIGRVGPARLTLAAVAADVGLAPATLIQRFGSKRGLMMALSRRAAESAPEPLRQARAEQDSPLSALLAGLLAMAAPVAEPRAFANHLAFLQLDLDEPEFRDLARSHLRAVREELRSLLDEAVAAGELRPADTAAIARAVQSSYNGALITWAIEREGASEAWLRRELETTLAPYRA